MRDYYGSYYGYDRSYNDRQPYGRSYKERSNDAYDDDRSDDAEFRIRPSYDRPYTARRIVKRRVYREIYWRRILACLIIPALLAGGIFLYFVWNPFGSSANYITVKSTASYYYVSAGVYETMQEAKSAADALKSAGGAGYILTGADGFSVAASVYKSRKDADAVAARLVSEGIAAAVTAYEIPSFKIAVVTDTADAKKLSSYFFYSGEIFDAVYRLSVELDEGNAAESYVAASLTAMRAKWVKKDEELAGFGGYPETLGIKRLYLAVSELFSSAIGYKNGANAGSNLKYFLCGVGMEQAACAGFLVQ